MENNITLSDLLLKSKQLKTAFIAAPTTKEAGAVPPMDPNMMAAMPPVDPNAAPIPPADPNMMVAGQPMMDSNAAGAVPSMDPNMPPPPPMPEPELNNDAEIMNIISQMAEGLDQIENRQNANDKKVEDIMAQFSEMQGKIDLLLSILGKGTV